LEKECKPKSGNSRVQRSYDSKGGQLPANEFVDSESVRKADRSMKPGENLLKYCPG